MCLDYFYMESNHFPRLKPVNLMCPNFSTNDNRACDAHHPPLQFLSASAAGITSMYW